MIEVHRLDAARLADFRALHQGQWCWCVAWWVPTWDGWTDRTEEENRALREQLPFDGYLAYVDGRPAGWCQVGPRDRLQKLVRQYGLPPDPEVWAVSCMMILPAHRGQGVASTLLSEVLKDLGGRGVRRVQAFPKRKDDPWTGPESMFVGAGFRVVRDDPERPVLAIDFS